MFTSDFVSHISSSDYTVILVPDKHPIKCNLKMIGYTLDLLLGISEEKTQFIMMSTLLKDVQVPSHLQSQNFNSWPKKLG